MGYGAGALTKMLPQMLAPLRDGAAILELGQQVIEPGIDRAAVLAAAGAIHRRDADAAQRAAALYDGVTRLPLGALYRGGPFRYACVDLYPGADTIVADLNIYRVPWRQRRRYDLITNIGTSEHVADQINLFRVVHDFAAPGAVMLHLVPFTGYLNHGLYNYQPIFFVFLAAANGYAIERLTVGPPWLPYTLPELAALAGTAPWQGRAIDSGDLGVTLRKRGSAPFRLFTDYDQAVMEKMKLPEPWAELLRTRHDLRVRG